MLIDSGAHKHSCVLNPLSTFLPASLSTCLKWKIKKQTFKEMSETEESFFLQMSSS